MFSLKDLCDTGQVMSGGNGDERHHMYSAARTTSPVLPLHARAGVQTQRSTPEGQESPAFRFRESQVLYIGSAGKVLSASDAQDFIIGSRLPQGWR